MRFLDESSVSEADDHGLGEDDLGLNLGDVIVDQEEAKRQARRLAAELGTVFNQIDRLMNLMRVYPRHHPIVDALCDQVIARLEPTLEREEEIRVKLEARELKVDLGVTCYSAEHSERDEFIWYMPFADGLKYLFVQRGLGREELLDVVRVLDRVNQGTVGSDDDTITLLWNLDTPHVSYEAVEGFSAGDIVEDFNCSEPEAVALVVDAVIAPGGEARERLGELFATRINLRQIDVFTRMQLEVNAELNMPKLRDEDLVYAFAIDDAQLQQIRETWTSGHDLEYRLIEALISIVRTSPKSDQGLQAATTIIRVVEQLLDQAALREAAKVLELLKDRRETFAQMSDDPIGAMLERLSDPMQIEALLNLYRKSERAREGVAELLRYLDAGVVQTQLLKMIATTAEAFPGEAQLIGVLIALSESEEHQSQLTSKQVLASSVYMRRMLQAIAAGETPEGWAPGPRLLRAGLLHDSPEVRLAALQLDHPLFADRGIAERAIAPMIQDGDEEIRKMALERLSGHRDLFMQAIGDTLQGDLGGRSRGELRSLMRTYLTSQEGADALLREMLQTRGLINASKRLLAKLAADVLVEAGDERAIALLRDKSKQWFVAADLKETYRTVLARGGYLEDAREEEVADHE